MKKFIKYCTKLTIATLLGFSHTGCNSYQGQDISGKWATVIDGQYCELWLNEGFALDWNYVTSVPIIRQYRQEGNQVSFSHPRDGENDIITEAWIYEIRSFRRNTFTAKIKSDGRKIVHKYTLISPEVPDLNKINDLSEFQPELRSRGEVYHADQ